MELKEYRTSELVKELSIRMGVQSIEIGPYEEYLIETTMAETDNIEEIGPAIILVIME